MQTYIHTYIYIYIYFPNTCSKCVHVCVIIHIYIYICICIHIYIYICAKQSYLATLFRAVSAINTRKLKKRENQENRKTEKVGKPRKSRKSRKSRKPKTEKIGKPRKSRESRKPRKARRPRKAENSVAGSRGFRLVLEACAFSPFSHACVSRFLRFQGSHDVRVFAVFVFSGFHVLGVFAVLRDFPVFAVFVFFGGIRDVRRCSLQVSVDSMLNGLVL